jgi:hypothetical protein
MIDDDGSSNNSGCARYDFEEHLCDARVGTLPKLGLFETFDLRPLSDCIDPLMAPPM